MPPRDVVRAINAGRVALGVGLVLAPRPCAAVWIGDDAGRRPETAVLVRAHGTREIVLGVLAMQAAGDKRLLRGLAVCDLVDLAATVVARRSLPRSSAAVAFVAAVGTAGHAWAVRRATGEA